MMKTEVNDMRVIHFDRPGEREEYDRIWNAVFENFDFLPSPYPGVTTFEIDMPHRIYCLPELVWDDEQEALIDQLMADVVHEEIYALDYNHLAYAYTPGEARLQWPGAEEFPTHYPNGDYYFFVAKDLSYGWLGHPWQKKLTLFGEKMLHLLNGYEAQLGLTEE